MRLKLLPVSWCDGGQAEIGDMVAVKMTATMNRTLYVYEVDEGSMPNKIGFVRGAAVPDEMPDKVRTAGVITQVGEKLGQVVVDLDQLFLPNNVPAQPLYDFALGITSVIKSNLATYPGSSELHIPDHLARKQAGFSPKERKEPIMEKNALGSLKVRASTIVAVNKDAMQHAAYLEAGRMVNNKFVQLAQKQLPLMLRGYADTPIGRLVIANIADIAARELTQREAYRSKYPMLDKLTACMVTQAYIEAIGALDIEGLIDNILGSEEVKSALGKLSSGGNASAE